MIRYDTTVVIGRSPRDVFTVMTDPDRYPDWTDMVDVRTDPGPPRVGARGAFRLAAGPIKGDLHTEVLEVEPDRWLVTRIDHPWLDWIATSELQPGPTATSTELRYRGEVSLRGWRRLLEPFVAGGIRTGELAEAERLRGILERDPA